MNTWQDILLYSRNVLAVVIGFLVLVMAGLFLGDILGVSTVIVILIIVIIAFSVIILASFKVFL